MADNTEKIESFRALALQVQCHAVNLAAIASEKILYPEVARCLAMRGAEFFLHSTPGVYDNTITPKDAEKISRAVENMAYVVSANTAGIDNIPIPVASAEGGSKIIDYRGKALAQTTTGEDLTAFAEIDLAALRRDRHRPELDNLPSRQRFELYSKSYVQSGKRTRGRGQGAGGEVDRKHFIETQPKIIARLAEFGII